MDPSSEDNKETDVTADQKISNFKSTIVKSHSEDVYPSNYVMHTHEKDQIENFVTPAKLFSSKSVGAFQKVGTKFLFVQSLCDVT